MLGSLLGQLSLDDENVENVGDDSVMEKDGEKVADKSEADKSKADKSESAADDANKSEK